MTAGGRMRPTSRTGAGRLLARAHRHARDRVASEISTQEAPRQKLRCDIQVGFPRDLADLALADRRLADRRTCARP
jgi:hypothetical protein